MDHKRQFYNDTRCIYMCSMTSLKVNAANENGRWRKKCNRKQFYYIDISAQFDRR